MTIRIAGIQTLIEPVQVPMDVAERVRELQTKLYRLEVLVKKRELEEEVEQEKPEEILMATTEIVEC